MCYLNSNETLEHNQLKVSTMFKMCAKAVTLFEDIMVCMLLWLINRRNLRIKTLFILWFQSIHPSNTIPNKPHNLRMYLTGKSSFSLHLFFQTDSPFRSMNSALGLHEQSLCLRTPAVSIWLLSSSLSFVFFFNLLYIFVQSFFFSIPCGCINVYFVKI